MPYHSALHPPADYPPLAWWTDGLSVALRHDVSLPTLPPQYRTCDVIYADVPWVDGFAIFNQRAETEPTLTYAGLMQHVESLVVGLACPAILVGGRKMLPGLSPDNVSETRLNGAPAVAACYGCEIPDTRDAREILRRLASDFKRGGDFFCGYGRTAETFIRAGGSFVASDFNPRCIGAIATEVDSWRN